MFIKKTKTLSLILFFMVTIIGANQLGNVTNPTQFIKPSPRETTAKLGKALRFGIGDDGLINFLNAHWAYDEIKKFRNKLSGEILKDIYSAKLRKRDDVIIAKQAYGPLSYSITLAGRLRILDAVGPLLHNHLTYLPTQLDDIHRNSATTLDYYIAVNALIEIGGPAIDETFYLLFDKKTISKLERKLLVYIILESNRRLFENNRSYPGIKESNERWKEEEKLAKKRTIAWLKMRVGLEDWGAKEKVRLKETIKFIEEFEWKDEKPFELEIFNQRFSEHNKPKPKPKPKRVESSHYTLGRVIWNYGLAVNLTKKFRETSKVREKIIPASRGLPFKDFIDGKFDVLLRGGTVYGPLSPYDKKVLTEKFGSPKNVRSYTIGHTVIYVVVHKRNPIKSLTLKQLEIIYRGTRVNKFTGPLSDWKQLGDGKKSGPIVWFMPPRGWYDSYVMLLKGMAGRKFGPRAKAFYKKPYAQQVGISAIVGNVIKDPNGIGFFAAPSGYEVDKRVKLLAIAVDEKSEPMLPTPENVYEGKYPIVDRMTLYLHPNAPQEAKEFCQFATSKEAVGVIKKHKLFPEYDRQKYFSE